MKTTLFLLAIAAAFALLGWWVGSTWTPF